jgi:hypothetical protein
MAQTSTGRHPCVYSQQLIRFTRPAHLPESERYIWVEFGGHQHVVPIEWCEWDGLPMLPLLSTNNAPRLGGEHANPITGAEPELSGARMPTPGTIVQAYCTFSHGHMCRTDIPTNVRLIEIIPPDVIDDGTREGIPSYVARIEFGAIDCVVPMEWLEYMGKRLD